MSKIRADRNPPRGANGRGAAAHEVGYGKPPESTRFKPGQSGNPKGRPKGSNNESTIFREIVGMKVQMCLGGKMQKVPYLQAMWMRVADEALKGDHKAIALIVNRSRLLEAKREESDKIDQDDQSILDAFIRGIETRFKQGERE